MNILFFGSNNYSLSPLEALHKAGHQILAVVTQPDRPVGRHHTLTATPVKSWALIHQIPVFTPINSQELSRLSFDPDLIGRELTGETSRSLQAPSKNKIDVGVVCVYGLIIPPELLSLPKYGFLNLHPSLLPKYRGASPVQAAIISGDTVTGVSIIKMDEKLDHGPIIIQEKEEVGETDTADNLYHCLFKKGSELLLNVLPVIPDLIGNPYKLSNRFQVPTSPQGYAGRGKPGMTKEKILIPPIPQDDSKASFTRTLKRDDGYIDWKFVKSALEGKNLNVKFEVSFIKDSSGSPLLLNVNCYVLNDFIRAFSPWPGAWTTIEAESKKLKAKGKMRLKLLSSHIENNRLVLDEVQLEGEKPTNFKTIRLLI